MSNLKFIYSNNYNVGFVCINFITEKFSKLIVRKIK